MRRFAVVPLESFALPARLAGVDGRNRAPRARCQIEADNDYAAILAWLAARGVNRHTYRAYRREAERWLLWAVLVREKPLSSMTSEDCAAFRDFLADPQPAERWVGASQAGRWSPDWRPFEGPLSPRSVGNAMTILSSLCGWLVGRRYLDSNPWDGLARKPSRQGLDPDRSFSAGQWRFLLAQADALPSGARKLRLQFVLRFAYLTGLRRSELIASQIQHLRTRVLQGERAPVTLLQVQGKGGKLREVPLPRMLLEALREYFRSRGFVDPFRAPAGTYLVGRLAPGEDRAAGVTDGALYADLKRFFIQAARAAETAEGFEFSAHLAKASVHWLRHTHGSHAAARGIEIDIIQGNLGHASLATTTVYVRAEVRRRAAAMEKLADDSA